MFSLPSCSSFRNVFAPFSRWSVLLLTVFMLSAAREADAAQVVLSWADNSSNESGFKVERATGSSGSFSQVATTGANAKSYTDASVATNSTYRYRVRAYNSAGDSTYSNTTTVNTGGTTSGNTAPTIANIADRTIATNGTTGAIAFTIGDAQTATSSLSLIKNSSDQSLVPLSGITFGGSGSNRTVTVTPAANKTGWSTIWVKVSDGQLSSYTSFKLTVQSGGGSGGNTAPTISNITDRTITINGSTGAIAFTIGDGQTATSSLTLIKNSSDQSLVPLGGITFGGSGSNRTVTVTPAANKTGWATIWVKVSDGQLNSYRSFKLTVNAGSGGGNTAPTISAIADRTVAVNGTTGPIPFTIGDAQTSAASLTLIRNASDQSLVPLSRITFGGSGANRTVTVRPAWNKTGWSTIWIKVSDGQLDRFVSFTLLVGANLTYTAVGATSAQASSFSTTASSAAPAPTHPGDELRFGHLPLEGDAELTVRVTGLAGSDDATRAGLMYRASTDANSACAGVYVTGASRIVFVARSADGASLATSPALPGAAPRWLRLTRVGDTFYGFTSTDGETWDLVEFGTVELPATALAGTAVTTPGEATEATASFEHLSID